MRSTLAFDAQPLREKTKAGFNKKQTEITDLCQVPSLAVRFSKETDIKASADDFVSTQRGLAKQTGAD